nr:hypothetical protein Iba_chr03bCG3270 [Ipomoea batatas]
MNCSRLATRWAIVAAEAEARKVEYEEENNLNLLNRIQLQSHPLADVVGRRRNKETEKRKYQLLQSRETPEVVAPEDAATLNYCRNFATPHVWTGGIPAKEGAGRRPPVVVVWTGGLGSSRLRLAGV